MVNVTLSCPNCRHSAVDYIPKDIWGGSLLYIILCKLLFKWSINDLYDVSYMISSQRLWIRSIPTIAQSVLCQCLFVRRNELACSPSYLSLTFSEDLSDDRRRVSIIITNHQQMTLSVLENDQINPHSFTSSKLCGKHPSNNQTPPKEHPNAA
jgi:hypothetical protein